MLTTATEADYWAARTWICGQGLSRQLVALHLARSLEPECRMGEDAAWRGLLRDLLAAATDEMDGDRQAAVGALAQALHEVAGEPD